MKITKVSVVMCVHNGAETVAEAIESILNQTFPHLEFIILDDGSTDETLKIVESYRERDERIVLLSQPNAGLTRSLNIAISLARGVYVARQDADDVSCPRRLERQVEFLDSNPEIALLGTNCYIDDGVLRFEGRCLRTDEINRSVYLHNPFAHSSAMFRLSAFKEVGGYDESFDTSQDFELWMRFAKSGPIAMLPEPLVVRRQSHSVISRRRRHRQYVNGLRARLRHPRRGLVRAVSACVYQLLTDCLPVPLVRLKRRLWS
jgi:glycosyltransferase involved in cell wall biosynthesis